MEVPIIKIGNSKGIRLSKSMLETYNIRGAVDVTLEEGQIVIKPLSKPRKGWDKAFKEVHDRGDDNLIIPDIFNEENPQQWK
jgi:antitoxin MazE